MDTFKMVRDTVNLSQDTVYIAQNVLAESEILKLSQQFYQDSFSNLLTVVATLFSIALAINIWSLFKVNNDLRKEVGALIYKSKAELETLSNSLRDEIDLTQKKLIDADIKLEAAIEFTQGKIMAESNPVLSAGNFLKSAINHARINNENAFSALSGAMVHFRAMERNKIDLVFKEAFNNPRDYILLFAKACQESNFSPSKIAAAVYELKEILEQKGYRFE